MVKSRKMRKWTFEKFESDEDHRCVYGVMAED